MCFLNASPLLWLGNVGVHFPSSVGAVFLVCLVMSRMVLSMPLAICFEQVRAYSPSISSRHASMLSTSQWM